MLINRIHIMKNEKKKLNIHFMKNEDMQVKHKVIQGDGVKSFESRSRFSFFWPENHHTKYSYMIAHTKYRLKTFILHTFFMVKRVRLSTKN